MTDAYFRTTAVGLTPEWFAHAPWSTDMLHGRLVGGLAARAIEAHVNERTDTPDRRVARLTVDLFRPAGMVPVQVETSTVRAGRRIEVIDAVVRSDGHDIARATAVVLATGVEPPGTIWQPPRFEWPDPDSMPVSDGAPDEAGWMLRQVTGGFESADRTRVWTNETLPLVDAEVMSPFVRAAISGDLACPLANSGDAGLHYINADYTLAFGRMPVGPWVGLEVAQHIAADGVSMASCTLVDEDGPFATSTGTSVTSAPLQMDSESGD